MYLAFGLHMQGAKLQPTSSAGPDLLLSGLPHSVWVEATVPLKGDGPNQVPEMHLGPTQKIPSEALILRYRTAIDTKLRTGTRSILPMLKRPRQGFRWRSVSRSTGPEDE
jgi:hypothetical protein